MSTKTLRKRIALVAVATLGAGVLSVAPAFATVSLSAASNGGSPTTSRGIITNESGAIKLQTMKMLATGSLYVTAAASTINAVAVSGATITSCDIASSGPFGLNSTGTACVAASGVANMTVVPNAGVTSFTISQYSDTAGTLVDRITVSIVAVTTVGTFSASKSDIYVDSVEETTWAETVKNLDRRYAASELLGGETRALSASALTVLNGNTAEINFDLYDANETALSSTTTGVTATATGGCAVGFTAATAVGASTTTVAQTGTVTVKKIAANAPAKCVVTLAVNGAAVATKSFNFLGQVTKLVVSEIVIAIAGDETADAFLVDAQDSAGNSIPDVAISNASTLTGAVSNIEAGSTSFADGGYYATLTCVSKGLAKDLKVSAVNSSAATIYSDAFEVQCSGSPKNYSASLDKASYTIGEVATLTITAKDSAGNLTYDGALLSDDTSDKDFAKYAPSMAGGPLTQVGAVSSSDSFTTGVKKYKFTVGGISGGSFQLVVDLPKYNSPTYSQSAVTVAYKVTTDNGGVSNADVLKAIVSLIASINKQIAALQKALLKK